MYVGQEEEDPNDWNPVVCEETNLVPFQVHTEQDVMENVGKQYYISE